MAGLNNFLSDTQQTTTTMPAWYDQAQQNVVSQGGQALTNAPTLGQTTAQGAINTLQGPNNPFTQAQGTLQQISSGAANPWIVDQSTGAVTPDTSTAMGGLFAAQQNELNQLMPNYTAPAQAGAIGSGNFGSLRGQTAVEKAKGDAFAKLNAAQMQAALTNQQTGSQAAANLGNVGQQGINAGMNVGQTQMNAPFNNLANYANLIGSMQTPTTTQSQVQYSPLSQIQAVGNAATGGLNSLSALYKTTAGKTILDKLGVGSLFSGASSSGGGTTGVDTAGQGQTTVALPVDPSWGSPVTGTGAGGGAGAGQILGQDGNIYTDPSYGTNAGGLDTGNYGPTDTGGNIDLNTGDTTVTDTQQNYGI